MVNSYPTLESAIGAMRFWDQARKNPRKLPLDVLIPRIQEVNEYIREGMKYGLSDEDGVEYRPITVNRAKQTVTFHRVQILDSEDTWKDSYPYDAKTKSDLSEIRKDLTNIKRQLTMWMRRSHSPKKMRPTPTHSKRSGATGRFTKNPRKAKKPKKPWNDLSRWPTIAGMKPWKDARGVQYEHAEDAAQIYIAIKLLKGGYRVQGEWSYGYDEDDWSEGEIDEAGLTYKQAIRAVKKVAEAT